MPGIRVVTDSACDLDPNMAEELNVQVVPLKIRFGDEELVDRVELSTKEFWDRVTTGDKMPSTAAPSPGDFQKAFEDAAAGGAESVVCLNLSSKLSATFQAATLAAKAVSGGIDVRVIDTESVTLGQGLMVIQACELIGEGVPIDRVVDELNATRKRTHVYAVIGTLDYLKKGGRIGGASHLVGSLLSIRPVIEVQEGSVEVESKQRTRSKALHYLAEKAVSSGQLDRLGVVNGVSPDIEDVLTDLGKAKSNNPMIVNDLGPVIGSHVGPLAVGVCFQTEATNLSS